MRKTVFLAVCAFFVTAVCFAQMPANMTTKDQAAPVKVETAGAPIKGECPYMKETGMGDEGMKGDNGMMMGHGMMGGMMGHGMMGGSMKEMMKSKMCSCKGASMIPADKGGVFVLSGENLYKFDKDLNLVKKVELEEREYKLPPCHPDIDK